MKYTTLLLSLAVSAGALTSQATPLMPYFGPLRDGINQQIGAVNSTVPVDKKLLGVLNGSLAQIDKPGTPSLMNDLKVLNVVVPALSKTSVSNVFHASLDGAVNNYLELVYNMADAGKVKLAKAYSSKVKDSAQKSLDKLYATLESADTNSNLGAAAKLIGKALPQWVTTDKIIASAATVPAPPSGVNAKVTGASSWSFKSTQAVAVTGFPANNVTVNSAQAILSAPYGQRTITFTMYGLQEGANSLSVGNHDFAITEVYGNGTGAAFVGSSGTIQVNYNSAAKTVAGTFNVTLRDQDNAGKVVTAVGDFSAHIQ